MYRKDTDETMLDYDEYNFTDIKMLTAGIEREVEIMFEKAFESSGEKADRIVCDVLTEEDMDNIDKIKEYLSCHCALDKLCYLTNNTLLVCTEGSDYLLFNPEDHGTSVGGMRAGNETDIRVDKDGKNFQHCFVKKDGLCKIRINQEKWYESCQAMTVDGKLAVTDDSFLFCIEGGEIYAFDTEDTNLIGELEFIFEAIEGAVVSGLSGEGGGGTKGLPVRYGFSAYLSKYKFGAASPQYYIANHSDSYIDDNGLVRISKISGIQMKSDYYCVAMSPGFTTAASKFATLPEKYEANHGYKLQVQFEDKNYNEYKIDVIVTDEKNSKDKNDFFAHNNIVEFVVDGKPQSTVTIGGNVSFDKLLGGNEVEIKAVYAFKEEPLITGDWNNGWRDK